MLRVNLIRSGCFVHGEGFYQFSNFLFSEDNIILWRMGKKLGEFLMDFSLEVIIILPSIIISTKSSKIFFPAL